MSQNITKIGVTGIRVGVITIIKYLLKHLLQSTLA